jgi:hypothetical protein
MNQIGSTSETEVVVVELATHSYLANRVSHTVQNTIFSKRHANREKMKAKKRRGSFKSEGRSEPLPFGRPIETGQQNISRMEASGLC